MLPSLRSCAPHPVSRCVLPGAAQLKEAAQKAYPSSHFQKAMYLRQRGDRDGALIEFLRAVQENPRLTRAFYEQALIFKDKGYAKLAQSSLQQALSIKPDFREARVLLATVYLESGDLALAAAELGRSLGLGQQQPNGQTGSSSAGKAPSRNLQPPLSAVPDVIQITHGPLREPPATRQPRTASPDAFKASAESPRTQASTAGDTGGWMQIDSSKNVLPETSSQPLAVPEPAKPGFQLNDLLKGIPGIDNTMPESQDGQNQTCPAAAGTQTIDRSEAHVSNSTPAVLPGAPQQSAELSGGVRKAPDTGDVAAAGNQGRGAIEKSHKDGFLFGMHMGDLFGAFKFGREGKGKEPSLAAAAEPIVAPPDIVVPEPTEKPSGRHRRHKRKHVAAWMDRFRSLAAEAEKAPEGKPPESERPPMLTATIGRPNHSVEELAADVSQTEKTPEKGSRHAADHGQPAPQDVKGALTVSDDEAIAMIVKQPDNPLNIQSSLPAVPAAKITPPTLPDLPSPAQRQESRSPWWPSPVDITRALKKVALWLPLPSPREQPGTFNLSQLPKPVASALRAQAGPRPLEPAKAAPMAFRQSPQARIDFQSQADVPLPQPGARSTGARQAQPAAMPCPASSPLENVLSILPKDLRKNFEQVHAQAPGPVKIAFVHSDSPAPLAQPPSQHKEPDLSGLIPQPVASAVQAFENLVSPRSAPQPLTPQSAIVQALQLSPLPSPTAPERISQQRLPQPAAIVPGTDSQVSLRPAQSCQPTAARGSAPVPVRPAFIARRPMVAPVVPAPSVASSPASASIDGMFRLLPSAGSADMMPVLDPLPLGSASRRLEGPVPLARASRGASGATGQAPQPVSAPWTTGCMEGPPTARTRPSTSSGQTAPYFESAGVGRETQRAAPSAEPLEISFATLPPLKPSGQPAQAARPDVQPACTSASGSFIAAGMRFAAPSLSPRGRYILTEGASKATSRSCQPGTKGAARAASAPPAEDPWVTRMKYLVEHGTSSLGPGEAFMFSEETGEGVMFLPGGKTVRRYIAGAKDPDEVARIRRPDIVGPGELQYNLSLLGKILPRSDDAEKKSQEQGNSEPFSGFTVNDLMNKSQGLWGWFKDVLKF